MKEKLALLIEGAKRQMEGQSADSDTTLAVLATFFADVEKLLKSE